MGLFEFAKVADKSKEKLIFLVDHCLDQWKMGAFKTEDFSTRKILDTLNVCLLQKAVQSWIERWLEKHQFPAQDTQAIRDALIDKRKKQSSLPGFEGAC